MRKFKLWIFSLFKLWGTWLNGAYYELGGLPVLRRAKLNETVCLFVEQTLADLKKYKWFVSYKSLLCGSGIIDMNITRENPDYSLCFQCWYYCHGGNHGNIRTTVLFADGERELNHTESVLLLQVIDSLGWDKISEKEHFTKTSL